MTARVREPLLIACAAAACVAGLILSAWTLAGTGGEVRAMARRHADLVKLRTLRDAWSGEAVAVEAFEREKQKGARDMSALLDAHVGGGRHEVSVRETRELPGGWILRSLAVSLGDVPLASVGRLLAEAEGQRPPWRLRECRITAATEPGTGRVALVLDRIEPAGAGAD